MSSKLYLRRHTTLLSQRCLRSSDAHCRMILVGSHNSSLRWAIHKCNIVAAVEMETLLRIRVSRKPRMVGLIANIVGHEDSEECSMTNSDASSICRIWFQLKCTLDEVANRDIHHALAVHRRNESSTIWKVIVDETSLFVTDNLSSTKSIVCEDSQLRSSDISLNKLQPVVTNSCFWRISVFIQFSSSQSVGDHLLYVIVPL